MKNLISFTIKKIIVFLDFFFHRKRINNYLKLIKEIKIETIYDVGSNNCEYSKLFSKIFPEAKIYAFEPNINLYEVSKIKCNDFKKIEIINKAVGNTNDIIDIEIEEFSPLTTSLAETNPKSTTSKIKKFLYEKKTKKILKVEIIKLDDFIKHNKCPDFIKIDVEGFEEEVLKGLLYNIKKIKLIMIEFHFDEQYVNYSTKRLHNLLLENDFKHVKSIKFPILNWEDRFYLKN